MRKEILKRFLSVLIITILATAGLFMFTVSVYIRNTTQEDMRMNLLMLDSGLNYEADLQEQIRSLPSTVDAKSARYTIFDSDGKVLADTFLERYDFTENHADRKEFKDAVKKGVGYSNRYSDTIHGEMLYTAISSLRSDCILRIAIPFRGNIEYMNRILPTILLSIFASIVLAYFSAIRLSNKLTKPFQDIVAVMERYQDDPKELKFDQTPYEELNIITDAAINMSESVKEYTKKLEFERMVRQEFFANASHELKTPITSIRGYMELMLGGFTPDEETKREFMNRVLNETEHITTLINDILMISQLESEAYEVPFVDIRMTLLLEDLIASFQPLALQNQIQLICECKPIVVHANMKQIRELISNLLSNAIKYNKPNGKVIITVSSEGGDLKIVVSDTGVGIPEGSQVRIFERFYRVDKGRSRKVGGTGLGLSIVKHIVHYYNGSVQLISKVDEGSTFTCILPKIIV